MKYVIIGNSIAAVGCIEGIRALDKKGSVTVIGAENHHVYGRPLISYLLEGKTDLERMKYRPNDFYAKNNVKTLLGVTAVGIDREKKVVLTDKNGAVPYDKLLIATGARPFVPRIPNLDKYPYHVFMTLDDALNLEKAIAALGKKPRILILGAGLIGLKCAEAVYKSAEKITVVDMADRVLPSILDHDASALIQKHIESKGIDFKLSTSADLDGLKAELSFDILCICTGVIPETGLAKDAGLEVGRGIYIDAMCRTTDGEIFAAGDCTESDSVVTGKRGAVPILPNAYIQGETAGLDMAGAHVVYDKAMPMNAIGFFGSHILTAGAYEGESLFTANNGYKKLFLNGGKLKGFIMIDDFKRAGIYTAMIRDGADISDTDRDALLYNAGLYLYPKGKRDEILRKE